MEDEGGEEILQRLDFFLTVILFTRRTGSGGCTFIVPDYNKKAGISSGSIYILVYSLCLLCFILYTTPDGFGCGGLRFVTGNHSVDGVRQVFIFDL